MRLKYFDRKMVSLWAALLALGVVMISVGPGHSLDSRFYYSGVEARQYLASLTPAQVSRYIDVEWMDFAFMALYSTICFLTLVRLAPHLPKRALLGFLPGAFDLVETSVIIFCLITHTDIGTFSWLGMVTTCKWSSVGVVVSLSLSAGRNWGSKGAQLLRRSWARIL